MPDTVSLPARLTRRSSRPAGTFSVFILAPSARAAERGRWAQAKKGQERVGRAGSLETLGHGCPVLFGSAWLPRLASREIGPVAGSGFLVRRRAWLGCSIRRPIRLRHAIFPDPVWLRDSMVCPANRGYDLVCEAGRTMQNGRDGVCNPVAHVLYKAQRLAQHKTVRTG